ncbi:MAG: helix-turn-helix domain-containing protein [Clostridium sp.]
MYFIISRMQLLLMSLPWHFIRKISIPMTIMPSLDAPAAPVTPSHASSEAQAIQDALKECNGNQTKAARLLGIDRSTLWRKLKKYNLNI